MRAQPRNKSRETAMPESASALEIKVFDPIKWKEYVEASFPAIEEKEFTVSTKEYQVREKKPKPIPQAIKMKQYAKLQQQSSVEEPKNKYVDNEQGISVTEKRRRFLLRKQTHSAPDSTDGEFLPSSPPPTEGKVKKTRNLCLGGRCRSRSSDSSIQPPSINLVPEMGIEHLDDLKYPDGDAPCHFCEQDFSQSIHDEARLRIVSGGLIQKRDGSSSESKSQYMNLPSPMLQIEEDGHLAFQRQFEASRRPHPTIEEDDVLPEGQLPPPSAFTRRKALASSTLRADAERAQLSLDEFARRSSTVVYPEMQICPGDLMVYSKALINSHLVRAKKKKKQKYRVDCEQIIRKGTWSILRIFDRHKKAGSIPGLEAFLEAFKRDFFDDPCLAKYRGLSWQEFYPQAVKDKKKNKKKQNAIADGKTPYDSDDDDDNDTDSDPSDKDEIIIVPEKESDRIRGDEDDEEKSDVEDSSIQESNPKVGTCFGSFRSERKPFDLGSNTDKSCGVLQEEKSLKTEGKSVTSLPMQEPPKPKKLLRAQSSMQLGKGPFKPEGVSTPRPKDLPSILRRGESSKQLSVSATKNSSKLAANLTDLFKKKDSTEKVWVDKGKAEKQETAMARFQKRLIRTQSERVLGLARFSFRPKEQSAAEAKKSDVSPISTVSQGEYKRREAVWDLFQTECIFLFDHLTVLKCVFLEPLKAAQVEGFLMFAEPQLLFGNLDELCRVTRNFCRSFIRLLKKEVGPSGELPTIEVLVRLFKKNEDGDIMTQAYHSYALNYINALNYLETLRSFEAFNLFEKWCATDKRARKLQLTDLLVAPVQHIMKIPLLLREVLEKTENVRESLTIAYILETEERSLRQLDDKMKWLKNYEHLLELQKNITWPSALQMDPKLFVPDFIKPALKKQVCDRIILSPRRKIIHEGIIFCWDSGKPQEVVLLLFDDMLLIAKKKKGPKKKVAMTDTLTPPCPHGTVYKQPLSLDRIHMYEPSIAEKLSARIDNLFLLIIVNRFQQVVTIHSFQATNEFDKDMWLLKLKSAQEIFKRNIETTLLKATSPQGNKGAKVNKESSNEESGEGEEAAEAMDVEAEEVEEAAGPSRAVALIATPKKVERKSSY